MRVAELIQFVFILLLALSAWMRPLTLRRQLKVAGLAALGSTLILVTCCVASVISPFSSNLIRDWLPAALLLVPYWQIGQFFTAPNRTAQARLATFDRALFQALHLQSTKASIGGLALYTELAYFLVYPLIPLGLAALYAAGMRNRSDYYWAVVLLATYACFAVTPFVQALPPRMLSSYARFETPPTAVRSLNRWILDCASIQAITFPSAHVASSTAAALVLLRLKPIVGLIFLWAALSIAVATVVGGYHYGADVIFAVLIAVLAFVGTLWLL